MNNIYDRSRYFELPKYFYFEAKNSTVGGNNTFNYRVDPVDDKLKIMVWYGMNCSELAEDPIEHETEHTYDGYKAMINWIDEQYEVYLEKLESGEVEGRRTYEERN